MSTVACQIYRSDGTAAPIVRVSRSTTIAELISETGVVLFTGPHGDQGGTPIIHWTWTLVDLNMWHPEPRYVAEISLYKATDVHLYNRARYEMYAGLDRPPSAKRARLD